MAKDRHPGPPRTSLKHEEQPFPLAKTNPARTIVKRRDDAITSAEWADRLGDVVAGCINTLATRATIMPKQRHSTLDAARQLDEARLPGFDQTVRHDGHSFPRVPSNQKLTTRASGPARRINQSNRRSGMSLRMASPIFMDQGKTQFRGRFENGAHQVHRGLLRLEHLHLALVGNSGAHRGADEIPGRPSSR